MRKIIVQFEASDEEMKQAISKEFGTEVEFIGVLSYDGLSDLVQALLPMAPQLADLLLSYLGQRKSRNTKRVIITKDGEVSLEGYTAKEIAEFINDAVPPDET